MTHREQLPAPKSVIEICDQIDAVVHNHADRVREFSGGEGYEGEIESMLLMKLVERQAISVTKLARTDLALLPSAAVCARAAMEAATAAVWITRPEDRWAQEGRFIGQLESEEFGLNKLSKRLDPLAQSISERSRLFREFREGLTELLPGHVKVSTKRPDVAAMLADIGFENMYPLYIWLSAFAHSTHAATGMFRRNLGIYKELGDFTKPSDWSVPLHAVWFGLIVGGMHLIEIFGGTAPALVTHEEFKKVQTQILSL